MTCYSTTLLPPSPLYPDLDTIITILCDRCLIMQEDNVGELTKQQYFDLTMALIEFWEQEDTQDDLSER